MLGRRSYGVVGVPLLSVEGGSNKTHFVFCRDKQRASRRKIPIQLGQWTRSTKQATLVTDESLSK